MLYNTQEFVPNLYAPYPAELPSSAEEVSEEDSPIQILAPDAPVLSAPNRITNADFDNWVEQRGSKFWTTWDPRYTPLIAAWDKDQQPQKGGWLHARVRQRTLHVLRVCVPPAAAVRGPGCLSPAGEPALPQPISNQ